jgi:hypothetical protein
MSGIGTKRTSSEVGLESAFRGKADYMCSERVSPFDPSRKWTVGAFGNTITTESERPVVLSCLHLDHLHD